MGEQEKIKIAIATRKMIMGGIEKSLIELCRMLVNKGFEVTLYLENIDGDLYKEIPVEVKVVSIFENYGNMASIIKKRLRKKNFMSIYAVFCAYLGNRFKGDPVRAWINTAKYLDTIDIKYDYAFAYGAPVSFSVIFIDKLICAKKKFVWIHNDVGQITLDIKKYRSIYEVYDKIVCVSKKAKDTFLEHLEEYESKTTVFYNIIDTKKILRQAEAYTYKEDFEGIRLLTVGRLSYEKGQDLIPKIAKRLVVDGYDIRWYCVGDGEDKVALKTQIRELKMNQRIILLGNQQNPYPFFKMADIYIQPSRNEGFGITISEAKIFGLPIVTTNFSGADEQITDKVTGLVVRFDENEIYNAIVLLLSNSEIRSSFKTNLWNDDKSCKSSLEELMS